MLPKMNLKGVTSGRYYAGTNPLIIPTLLIIILALVCLMTYEFYFFSSHYEALERVSDDTLENCNL